jgi:hypothetical protein
VVFIAEDQNFIIDKLNGTNVLEGENFAALSA